MYLLRDLHFTLLYVVVSISTYILPHYHSDIDIAIYVGRRFRSYVSFTGFAFYIVVRCGFDKHLYLTSCLNAHNHNTCIHLPQTGCMALFIISQDRQTQDNYLLLCLA